MNFTKSHNTIGYSLDLLMTKVPTYHQITEIHLRATQYQHVGCIDAIFAIGFLSASFKILKSLNYHSLNRWLCRDRPASCGSNSLRGVITSPLHGPAHVRMVDFRRTVSATRTQIAVIKKPSCQIHMMGTPGSGVGAASRGNLGGISMAYRRRFALLAVIFGLRSAAGIETSCTDFSSQL